MAEKNNETIKKARTEMEYLTGDEEVRRMAELREKWEMDYISASNSGKRDGAQKEKIEIAKKLLKLEIDIEKIIEATGLSKEEIEKIKKEI